MGVSFGRFAAFWELMLTRSSNCTLRRPHRSLKCSWYISATLKQAAVLDVRQFIDEHPLSSYQLLVASLCGAIVFIDGFDAQVMGPVAPALSAQLHIARVALGSVLS